MQNHQAIRIGFYIRQNRNIKRDYSAYCCIRIDNERSNELCVATGIKKDEWDSRKGRPKQKTNYLIKLAIHLDTIKAKLLTIYLDLKMSGTELSSGRIKNIYLGTEDIDLTILQLIDKAVEKYQKELAPGSLKNYAATRAYVESYCKTKFTSGDVRLKVLRYPFIDELHAFILGNPLKPNDPCTNNGCMKHLERIKKMIRWAFDMQFIEQNVFSTYKLKKKRYESKILTHRQLHVLENKILQRPMLNLVRDLFVFSCYTGMSPADIQSLKPHQVYLGTDNLIWLSYTRGKSKMSAHVPLLKPAIALVKKYEPRKGDSARTTVFPLVTNKDLNSNLKIIGEICETGISINFYIARHTFATTITLSQGVPITSIKEMMGHEKIESTMLYARTSNSMIAKDMMLVQEKMDQRDGYPLTS